MLGRALFSALFLFFFAVLAESKVIKQIPISGDVPEWRSSMRVRQMQGMFPRLSSFYDSGFRPRLFNGFEKRMNDWEME